MALSPDEIGPAASIPQLLAEARRRLPSEVFDYIELGGGGETTAQRNRHAFGRWEFAPRLFSGAAAPALSTRLGRLELALPVITAPFGNDTFIHPEGHLAVARAVRRSGTVNIAPHGSGHSLEDIAAAADGSLGMFQVGLSGSDDEVLSWIDRAAAAGYPHVLFTHLPVRAWRERIGEHAVDLAPYGRANERPARPPRSAAEAAELLRWDWNRFESVARRSALPWFLKGVQEPADARRAIDCGAAGIYVSNYGGRNLDCVPASIDRLAVIADEVAGAAPIVFDSGIRRGADVVKALALGADVVAVGRLTAFSLGAAGEEGVHRMLELLAGEIVAVMAELGVHRPEQLNRNHLQRADGFVLPPLAPRNREV
jgi:4-hydroxymandelate oxidase